MSFVAPESFRVMRVGPDVRVNGTKIAFKARKMNVTSKIRHFRRDDTFKVGVKLYTRDFDENTPPAPGAPRLRCQSF